MDIRITPSPLSGKLQAIPSKSHAHRAFICAALCDKGTEIKCSTLSNDIEAMISCLNDLGADISFNNGIVRISPITAVNKKCFLDCSESGTTLRFILPLISALGTQARVNCGGRLPERPIAPLVNALTSHGAVFKNLSYPLECGGKLRGGNYSIEGNISSQFISGLLMVLPLLEDVSILEVRNNTESKPYINMTLAVMRDFGVTVEENGSIFKIKGCQKYISPVIYEIEGDWSNGAFWLVSGALAGNGIEYCGLSNTSSQGDKAIIPLLKNFGANITEGENFLVRKGNLKGINIDASNIPDLVPVLSVIACAAKGKTVIFNAQRLKHKESDRLETTSRVLKALGADIEITQDGLIINSRGRLEGGEANSYNDHRIPMSLAVAAIICNNDVIIKDAQAVNKSYPAFFDHYALLGGNSKSF